MTDVFESILNISISALWLILAAICARALLFRAPKWTRMLLWALVAVRLVIPFTVESPLSLVPETKAVELTIREADSPNEPIHMDVVPVQPSPITPVEPIAPSLPVTEETPKEDLPPAELPADGDTAKAEEKPVNVGFILSVVWIAGIALMAGYFAFSYLSLRFRLRDAVRSEGKVWYSDRIDTAFIFGIINARIYLPFGIEGTAAEHVLAHERAHLKRGDHIIKPLAFFILSLHWFNPAVWLAYILFCKDVELACDEAAIRGMNEDMVIEYSHALVSLSTKGSRLSLHPISFGGANMKNRLKNILNYKKPALWIIIAALILCAIVAVCFFTSPAKSESTDNTEKPAESENSTEPTETPTDENGFPLDHDRSNHIFPYSEENPIVDVIIRKELTGTATGDPRFDVREMSMTEISVDEYVLRNSIDYVYSLVFGNEITPTAGTAEDETAYELSIRAVYKDGSEISTGYTRTVKDGVYYRVEICDEGNKEFKERVYSARDVIRAEFDSMDNNIPEAEWITDISADGNATWKYVYNGEEFTENYCMSSYVQNVNHYYSEPYPMAEISAGEFPAEGDALYYLSGDGAVRAIMRITDNGEYIYYNGDSGEKWYQAKVLPGHRGGFVSAAYEAFMNYKFAIFHYRFAGVETAEYAVESFANWSFPRYLLRERFGRVNNTDYKLISYQIEDSNETAVVFTINYMLKPTYYDDTLIAAGISPGEGEYEGWYNCRMQYLLEYNSADRYWYVTQQGSGGITLPKN